MNIFRFELRRQLRSSIIWTLSILAGLFMFMSGIWPEYHNSAQDLMEMMKSFPKEFMSAFGMNIELMFSYTGFYNFTFGYVGLMGAIMAAGVAIGVFSREKRSKCMDYIMTKPLTRQTIFLNKLLACLTIIAITSGAYSVMVVYLFASESEVDLLSQKFVLSVLAFFFTQLMFMAFGVCFATLLKKVRSISGSAVLIGIVAFVLSAVANMLEKEAFLFLAPLKYFDPSKVMTEGHYDLKLAFTGTILSVACILISYYKYCKSDIAAL